MTKRRVLNPVPAPRDDPRPRGLAGGAPRVAGGAGGDEVGGGVLAPCGEWCEVVGDCGGGAAPVAGAVGGEDLAAGLFVLVRVAALVAVASACFAGAVACGVAGGAVAVGGPGAEGVAGAAGSGWTCRHDGPIAPR